MSTVEQAVRCPRCGTLQPPTLDFCNGHFEGAPCLCYLGWSRAPATAPSPAQASPATAARNPAVSMTVSFRGVEPPADGAAASGVAPGDRVTLDVTLRNIGRIVDEFGVTVQGLPQEWVQPPAAAVHLVPVDHEGHSERHLSFVLAPPRVATATAGAYQLAITVRSQALDRTLEVRQATLVVRPFLAVTATARPSVAQGRTSARFHVDVRNGGNAPIAPVLVPSGGDELRFAAPSGLTAVAPGDAVSQPLTVRCKRLLIGQPVFHQLQVGVAVNGLDPPAVPLALTFRQKPLIAWWVPVALALLAALAIALYAVWPRKVTMPLLKGSATVFVAERRLERAGFKTAPKVVTRVRSDVKSGTVLDQTPLPFARVTPDTPIVLRIAVPATFTIIPDLTGMTVAQAEDDLHRRYLKLGTILPADAPATRTIASQLPLPGRARSRDVTAVDVVLAAPGKVNVPRIVCKTLSQAEKILTRKGLVLGTPSSSVTSSQVATSQVPARGLRRPLGTTVTPRDFELDPQQCQTKAEREQAAKAAKGASTTRGSLPARVVAAAGEPVAFDDGRGVLLAPRGSALATGQQPAWSPDGTLLAMRVGPDLRIVSPPAPGIDPVTIRLGRDTLGAPAFAPMTVGDPLLAFLATSAGGDSRLCLARVGPAAAQPSCLDLPRLHARSIAWSPGASVLLVVGARAGASDRPGVLRVRLTREEPAEAASWSVDPLLWRLRLGARTVPIFHVAYDPRAQRLAVVTSSAPAGADPAPQVALMDLADWPNLRNARWLERSACQIAWSPTGARLAVVEVDAPGACPADPQPGRLVTLAVDRPSARTTIAEHARNPAWRP